MSKLHIKKECEFYDNLWIPICDRIAVVFIGVPSATWIASHEISFKWCRAAGINWILLIVLNSPLVEPLSTQSVWDDSEMILY